MPHITQVPYITLSELKVLLHAPGLLEVDIKKVEGVFLPFILFTKPGKARVMHGVMVHNNTVLSSNDLGELIDQLRESLGFDYTLHLPKAAEVALH